MNKEKILLVTYNNLELGGIQNVLMNIVRHLSKEYIFDIVCFDNKKGHYDDEVTSFGGSIYRIGKSTSRDSFKSRIDFYIRGNRIVSAVKSIISEGGPYIAVHSNKGAEDGLVLQAARECNVPIRIAHAHTAFERHYNPLAKLYTDHLLKLVEKHSTVKIACSKAAGENSFRNKDYHIIYNTVDRRFLENRDQTPLHNTLMLLQVGLICDNKNQQFSLHVLYHLKKLHPGAQLTFIGAPKDAAMQVYYNKLVESCKQLGVDDSVTFLPANADVCDEMMKATYVLFPSKEEGLGIVPIEAQSLGMKCFISASVSREVDCGGCVFLSLNDGAVAWAECISGQFEKDRGKRTQYDISRFHPDVIMEHYEKLYRGELRKNDG